MAQALDDMLARDPLQVITRLAQTNAANTNITDHELPAHQMIQWYVSSDNVAASIARGEFDVIFATKSLNRLRLDQREFEIRLGLVERALLEGVTISFEPHTGNQNRTTQSPHRLLSAGGDVNRLHSSIPHRTPPITKDDYAFFSTIVIDS